MRFGHCWKCWPPAKNPRLRLHTNVDRSFPVRRIGRAGFARACPVQRQQGHRRPGEHRSAGGDKAAADKLAHLLSAKHTETLAALINDVARRDALQTQIDAIIDEAANSCRGVAWLRELTPRSLDSISGVGERLSVRLMSATLESLGVPSEPVEATEVIVTDDTHGGALPLTAETRGRAQSALVPRLRAGLVPVVTGFIAASKDGTPTTLGRGGSDLSATILGAALDAADVIIWTDVDGVLTADPRLVPDATLLLDISYNEAAELAFFGAKVLHPSTLHPVRRRGIPVWIRNSFSPEIRGTMIGPDSHPTLEGVKAVTAIRDVTLLTVGGPGIIGVPEVAAWTFAATAEVRARILLISQASSQDDICFVVHSADAKRTVEALRRTFLLGVRPIELDHIHVNDKVAIVAVVGDNMRGTTGVAGRVFGRLGRESVNIIAIAQGSSENNISFLVDEHAVQRAVSCIHNEFHLEKGIRAGAPQSASAAAPATTAVPAIAAGERGASQREAKR